MSKTFCGSAAYAAPEILQGISYFVPLHDIWAMGVILYIMVSTSVCGKAMRHFLRYNKDICER